MPNDTIAVQGPAIKCKLMIVNSIQNKLEELENIIKKINAHIIFASETKIDKSYPDRQFSIPGFRMYRNDSKKGRWRSNGVHIFQIDLQETRVRKEL